MTIIDIKRKVNIVSASSNVVILSTELQDTKTSFANQKITLPRVLAFWFLFKSLYTLGKKFVSIFQ